MTALPTRRRAQMRLTGRRAGVLAAAVAAVLVATPLVADAAPAPAAELPAVESPAIPDPEAEPVDRSTLGLDEVSEPTVAAPEPDRVLVRFAPGISASAKRGSIEAADGTQGAAVGSTGFVAVVTAPGDAVDVASELDADPLVADVQVDHVRTSSGVEVWGDDYYVDYAWPYLDLTTLPSAWEVADGRGVTIAVLDTGVNTAHEDFAGRIVPGADLVGGGVTNSHGTLVASIAASGANGVGTVGAAYAASIMPVRVLDDAGQGSDSTIAAGIDWASSHGAQVINLSLGGPGESPVLLAAMQTAVARGSIVVVAAGNSGDDVPQYPAAYAAELSGVLSVTSTNDDGVTLYNSSWGDSVSLAAPGESILGADLDGDSGYSIGTGTSMAAPLVSGAAALVLQKNPTWTPADVAEQLKKTARDTGPRGVDPYHGTGILDAAASLGLTPAVPFDREVGDLDVNDDVPSRARAATVGKWETVRLWGQADIDWLKYTTVAGADYDWSGTNIFFTDRVALDREGRRLRYDHGSFHSELGGPVYIGIWAVDHHFGEGGVKLSRRTDTPLVEPQLTFRPDVRVGAAINVETPIFADVTGDGVEDVVGGTYGGLRGGIALSAGRADGLYDDPVTVTIPEMSTTGDAIVADVTGDPLPEVVGLLDHSVYISSARGGSLSEPVVIVPGLSGASAITSGDGDGDGDIDLFVQTSNGILLARNNAGSFATQIISSYPGAADVLLAVDVDGDARLDLLLASGRWLKQQADRSFVEATPIAGLSQSGQMRFQDIDGDSKIDLVGPDRSSSDVPGPGTAGASVMHGLATGGFGPATWMSLAGGNPLASDINGDGRTDIVTATNYRLQAADGTFPDSKVGSVTPGGDTSGWVVARDVTSDGLPDVVRARSGVLTYGAQTLAPAPKAAWVWSITPEGFATGVGVRPDITVVSRRDLTSVATDAFRLVDADGHVVPADVTVNAGARSATLRPRADLAIGGHYEVLVTGLVDTDSDVMSEVVRSWFTVGAAGQRYTPVDPVRWLDTRQGGGPIKPGSPVDLSFFEELPEDATAVVLNVTAAAPVGAGFVRVFPTPVPGVTAEPSTSSLNLANGIDQPNLVTVKLGFDRNVRISSIWTTTHVVVDLAGYYGTGAATAYTPLAPVRVMDNRTGENGSYKGRIGARKYVDLQVAGKNGVPADASAVVLNVTGVNPPARTTVRVYPTPEPFWGDWRPEVSNLNLMPGRDQPNLVTVKVGWNGKVRFYVHNTDMYLVAYLAGYFSPTGANGYTAMDPVRLADTRTGLGLPGGRMVPAESRTLKVAGKNGIPADATAAVFNVTGARPGYLTVIRVFPAGLAQKPFISNLNLVPGRDDPNMVISKIGTGGGVVFYTHSAATDLVVDVGGYFKTFR